MAFDLSTAQPVASQSGGFDLSTAQPASADPVQIDQPVQTTQPRQIGRPARAQAIRQEGQGTQDLLTRFEAGEITSADLTPEQTERVRLARIEAVPEITSGGVQSFLGGDVSRQDAFITSLVGLTTFDPAEFGQQLTSQFPFIGVVTTPEGETIAQNRRTGEFASLNKPNISPIDILQGLGVVGAFTPTSMAAKAAPAAVSQLIGRQVASPTGVRALAGGAGAGVTETAIQATQEAAGGTFDAQQVGLAAGLGAAAEVVQPAAEALGRSIRNAVRGTEETAEQAARRTALEAEGLIPTRAQVTRNAKEFQEQQSIAKTDPDGPIAARLEQQEARLQGAFEQRALDTEGNVVTSTSTPIDEVLNRSIVLDEKISDLYRQAREAAPTERNIKLNSLASSLRKFAGEENVSGGLISSVKNNLKSRGIIDKDGRVAGRISVETAEAIRIDINALFDSVTDRGRQLSRQLKNNLDDDVLKQSGGDVFNVARSAKREFEQGLSRAQISKFDKRKSNLVRDMLDNKVSPDTFIDDVVFAKKWRRDDLNQLRSYLNQTEKGKQAWNDIKAQTVDRIRELSFTGPVREDGVTQSLSRAALEKTLDKLDRKLIVLFDAEERAFLSRMREISALREPPPGRFQGGGPTEVAVSQIKNRFPIVGPLFESLSQFKQNRLLLSLPARRPQARPGQPRRTPTQAAQTIRTDEE
ncbi:MAG: hypothetical protein JKY53_00140 [Flavobacteriales bacterium]|nr:hypothetical protein [Flavobacteriales bacterium]